MPSTYTLISSNVLTATTQQLTFSSIPQTFTDLVLRMSYRVTTAGLFGSNPAIRFNSDATSNYSYANVNGDGSTASSSRESAINALYMQSSDSAGNTADTFTSTEVYIPNYTGTANKPISISKVAEQNSTAAEMAYFASLYRGTSAISTILIGPSSNIVSNNFVSGSSFYLYGIKNS
jgi:hypothetical protein